MRAILANQAGGPDVLSLVEQPDPEPGPGQLVVRTAAAGVDFRDLYEGSGGYAMPFPHVPGAEGAGAVPAVGGGGRGVAARERAAGAEGAGTVLAVGDGVSGFAVGDRVAWADARGSYAELVVVPAEQALPVPDGVELEVAAAVPLQGMTAHYLVTSTFPVQRGHTVL